jgi:type II secretory pathway pseudopilin PulG
MADSTRISPRKASRRARGGAFTLIELLVALGISVFVLSGVLTAAVQLARGSVRVTQYAEMDTQVRRSFEQLAVDLKAASAITLNSATDLTITKENSDGTASQFTYAWNSSTRSFYRVPGADSSVQAGRLELVAGASALSFSRLDTSGSTVATDNGTKQIKVAMTLRRAATGAAASSSTVATTVTLRNKPVS